MNARGGINNMGYFIGLFLLVVIYALFGVEAFLVSAVLISWLAWFPFLFGGRVSVDETSGSVYGRWLSVRRIHRLLPGGERARYMTRIYLLPNNKLLNLYLHIWHGSDNFDEALHDHPWPSWSMLLRGRMIEHLPTGKRTLLWGKVEYRSAEFQHAIEIPKQPYAPITIFATGSICRGWRFICRESGKVMKPKDFHRGGGCN